MKLKRNKVTLPQVPLKIDPIRIEHNVKHEYGLKPQPTQIYVELINDSGARWIVNPFYLAPGQRDVKLNSFPLMFLTGREEDNGKQVQGMTLRFEW